jgi:predicted site-specific integrase-resolvase
MYPSTVESDPLIKASVARQQWGGISPVTEWRWIKRGVVPEPIKINGRNYYRQSTVNALGGLS